VTGRAKIMSNNAPVFYSGKTGVFLNETALVGTTAYTSAVSDADGDSMTYALSGTDASSFAVSSTGVVTLNAALDFETKATYEFKLTASDGNGGSTAVNVDGAVIDRTENPFTVTSSWITEDLSGIGIDGRVGDTLVKVSTAFSDFDGQFISYDASEIVYFEFYTDGSTLEDVLVVQTQALGMPKYRTILAEANAASPAGIYDIGVTAANMISGTSTKDLILFVVDRSKVTSDFDITVSGTYDVRDFGADGVNGGSDDITTNVTLDPFTFTINVANDAPTITTTTSLTTDEDTATAAIAFTGADIDGDTLTFTFSDPPKGSVANNDDGTFTYTPDANANGADSFNLTANDGTVDVAETVNVTINAVNDAPLLHQISGLLEVGTVLTATVGDGIDPDGTSTSTFLYQWLRDGTNLIGGTSSTYLLNSQDVGSTISVKIDYVDDDGSTEGIISNSASIVSDLLVGTTEIDVFEFTPKGTGGHGPVVIRNFDSLEDKLSFKSYTDSKITKTLDVSGYDHFIFTEDNDLSTVTLKSSEIASSLKVKEVVSKTLDISGLAFPINEQGELSLSSAQTISSVKIDGISSLKSSIAKQGETNASNPINLSDVLAQLKHIIGLRELKANALQAGDTNNDGEVNLSDVLVNLKHIIGLREIDTFDLVTDNGFAINALDADSKGDLTLVINGDADQSHADWDFV
jgi:hypothetical protein